MTTEPKHGLKEIVTMSEQNDDPVNRPDEPWETITAYGNVGDMTLHPILRRAYRVACLIERAPHASIEQTTASSAAFSLVEELYLSISALIGKELLSRSKAAAYDILITDKPHGNDCNVSVRGHSEADALIAAKDAEIAGLREDAELGRVAMQFVDRAGDVCEEDPAERICDEFNIAMAATVELQRRAARSKQEKRDE